MLGGEKRKSKVYASCLDVLGKLTTSSVWIRGFKDKHMLRGWFKARKPQVSYREGI